jgi:LPXTG-motif cell wall-anchored protein
MISVPLLASTASAGSLAAAVPEGKVVVCKYVGTPPGTPHHIIVVAASAIKDWDGVTFPWTFADAQDSIAIRYAIGNEQPGNEELVNCPGYVPPPEDACQNLDGDQPEGFQCEPDSQRQTRDLGPLLDCDAGTLTTLHQERTRTQDFDAETQEWVWGDWSDWATFDTTVDDATAEDCPEGPPPPPGPGPEGPPAGNPPPGPTVLPNTGSPAYLASLAVLGGLILSAGGALFVRSRKVL